MDDRQQLNDGLALPQRKAFQQHLATDVKVADIVMDDIIEEMNTAGSAELDGQMEVTENRIFAKSRIAQFSPRGNPMPEGKYHVAVKDQSFDDDEASDDDQDIVRMQQETDNGEGRHGENDQNAQQVEMEMAADPEEDEMVQALHKGAQTAGQ